MLNELKIKQIARVISIKVDSKIVRRHLLDMGMTRGAEIEIKKIAPLGDTIDMKLRGYELCIRADDLKGVEVEVIK